LAAAQHLRDVAALPLLDLAEDEDEPLLVREDGGAGREDAEDFLALEPERALLLDRSAGRTPSAEEAERLALGPRPRAPRPESVDREVAGDAEEPGRERPRGVVSVEVLPHPHERELRDVA